VIAEFARQQVNGLGGNRMKVEPVATPIKIEKGVPLPSKVSVRAPHPYPFAEMQLGDSFIVPIIGDSKKFESRLRYLAMRHRDLVQADFDYVICMEGGGVRFWRVPLRPRRAPRRTKTSKTTAPTMESAVRVHRILDDDEPTNRGPARPRTVEGRAYK
jgi:hypothetical protein